jgi:3-dehydroquinate synthase
MTVTATVTVDLGARTYPIYIGPGLLDAAELIGKTVASEQIVIISNEIVAPLYLERLRTCFAPRDCLEFILPDGEGSKNLDNFSRIMSFLLERTVERSATIVALGGGVVGDLAGFVAASYQRGVAFVQVPTTLLAQVDSAVGGKTAVNHPLGKNMIGAFYQPQAVFADTTVLSTLPAREFSAGLAEVIKYGLIRAPEFLTWLEDNLDHLIARDDDALSVAIQKSCEHKAAVVAADEREGGVRATLNLGHTFGHAIESALGYGTWLHGEAVAAGTCMAARMSQRMGWLDNADVRRVESLFRRAALPIEAPATIDAETFLRYMGRDKKNIGGHIRLVLLKALGDAVVTSDYSAADLSATLTSST